MLRLKYYFENLSLWLDEAALGLEILRRSFAAIFFATNYNQYSPTAPVGFLLLEKSALVCLGSREWVLRLLPLACSVFSVFLFLPLARRYVRGEAVPAALALFAFAGPLIYYSAQVKPYSCDVLIAVFVLWGAARVCDASLGLKRAIAVGVIAAAVLWFSYGALFVVSGALMVLMTFALIEKRWGKISPLFWVACLAGSSFVAIYFNEITQISDNGGLSRMWKKAFMPWPVGSLASILWLKDAILSIFKDDMGQPWTYLASGLFFVGTAAAFARNKERCFLLVAPIVLVLVAAAAHKYPFSGRLVLFLVPSLALLMAEGITYVAGQFSRFPAAGVLLIAMVFFYPVKNAVDVLTRTHAFEEMRPIMRYLKEHYQKQDAIFLNNSAQYAYGYYSGYYSLDIQTPFAGVIVDSIQPGEPFDLMEDVVYMNYVHTPEGFLTGYRVGSQIDALFEASRREIRYNKRIWIILSHASEACRQAILDIFEREGKRLDEFHSPGVSIYLYDLSRT